MRRPHRGSAFRLFAPLLRVRSASAAVAHRDVSNQDLRWVYLVVGRLPGGRRTRKGQQRQSSLLTARSDRGQQAETRFRDGGRRLPAKRSCPAPRSRRSHSHPAGRGAGHRPERQGPLAPTVEQQALTRERQCRLRRVGRLFAAVNSPRVRLPVMVSLGGCHLLGQGLLSAVVSRSFEVLAVERGEVDAVGLVGDQAGRALPRRG